MKTRTPKDKAIRKTTSPAPATIPMQRGEEDIPALGTPQAIGRAIIAQDWNTEDGPKLKYWQDGHYLHDGFCYNLIPPKEFKRQIGQKTLALLDADYRNRRLQYEMAKATAPVDKPPKSPKETPLTRSLTGDISEAIECEPEILLVFAENPSMPIWLEGEAPGAFRDLLSCRNGLLHVPSYMNGDRRFMPNTVNLFNTYSVPHLLDFDAPEPTLWLQFLAQVYPDQESRDLLQEWIGYLLTPDTSRQKILMLTGESRSGKGTINRIIKLLIKESNVLAPQSNQFGQNFGSAMLLHKQLCVFNDLKVGPKTDAASLVEMMLTVSGEDSRTSDRKNRGEFTGTSSARVMMSCNEVPVWAEGSRELMDRFEVIHHGVSFRNKPDETLTDRLALELPQIFRWALDGLVRLRTNGRFTRPESAANTRQNMDDANNTVRPFYRDCIEEGEGYSAFAEDLWAAYVRHEKERHVEKTKGFPAFCKAFQAIPGFSMGVTNPRRNKRQPSLYHGLRLKPDLEAPITLGELWPWLQGSLGRGQMTEDELRAAANQAGHDLDALDMTMDYAEGSGEIYFERVTEDGPKFWLLKGQELVTHFPFEAKDQATLPLQ